MAVQELRIVDRILEDAIKARDFSMGRTIDGNPLNRAHWRCFLLTCGGCAGEPAPLTQDRCGCTARRSNGQQP